MFFRKNMTYDSCFAKKGQNNKKYEILPIDRENLDLDQLKDFYQDFHIAILSSSDLVATLNGTLFILNQFNLKEISSILLNVTASEHVHKLIELPHNQLQIILQHNETRENTRILFYNVRDINYPKKTREMQIEDLNLKPGSIFYINDIYVLSFENKVEIRNGENFSLIQTFGDGHGFIEEIVAISPNQFLSHSRDGIYLWTQKNNQYYDEKLFSTNTYSSHAHMCISILNAICLKNTFKTTECRGKEVFHVERGEDEGDSDHLYIYDLNSKENLTEIIPHHGPERIFKINIIDNLLLLHLNNYIELRDIKNNQMIDFMDSENTWMGGDVLLLNNACILYYHKLKNIIEMIDFPIVNSYRNTLDDIIN